MWCWLVLCAIFLSRLCGGEVNKITVNSNVIFLSRLCGGEAKYENDAKE